MADKFQTTSAPESNVAPKGVRLTEERRKRLGIALWNSIDSALGNRSELDDALESWNDLYELRVSPKNFPWPNSSNLAPPLIPTFVDTMVAQLSGLIFVQRFFIVSGNDPQAAQFQHEVERYYNTELWRHGWLSAFADATHLAIRDGTAAIDVLWRTTTRKRPFVVMVPQTDEQTGMAILDEQGNQVLKSEVREQEIEEYDDVELTPVPLKDILLIPNWSPSAEEATALGRALYLGEDELFGMASAAKAAEGQYFYPDAIERALDYTAPGDDERGGDRQGTSTADAGGRINVTGDTPAGDSDLGQARGPIKVWRLYSRQFDLDKDGVRDEYVFWVHENSGELLGLMPYPYYHGKRSLNLLSPMPRPEQAYGYSLIERLAPIYSEYAALKNQKRDFIDYCLNPIKLKTAGAVIKEHGQRWAPGEHIEVSAPTDLTYLIPPPVPQDAWIEEQSLMQLAERLTGLSDPMQGRPPSNARTTAKAVQLSNQNAGVRLNMIAARVRAWAKEIFYQVHQLKLQYGPDQQQIDTSAAGQPQRIDIDKQKLGQQYTLDIAGNNGPLDKTQQSQDALFLYSTLAQNPIVQSDPRKLYRVTRMLVEAHDVGDAAILIGTEDEAVQQAQQAQQAAKQQAAAQQQHDDKMALLTGHQAAKPNGRPPQQAHAP